MAKRLVCCRRTSGPMANNAKSTLLTHCGSPAPVDLARSNNYNLRNSRLQQATAAMPEDRAQRRLAAILVADVVGYSRLMEADEAGTLAALRERRRSILTPLVAEH